MITPDIIIQPFAASAPPQDVTIPPQSSSTGFVNFSDGYTRFYEINLASNDPQAKAVERGIMNYMFNALTKNAMAWQSQGFAAWYAGKAGGYEQGAFVMRITASVMTPYRSLVNANVSDPLSTPAQWEPQPTAAAALLNVPMPHGGASGPSAAVIRAAVDLNTMTDGTWEVATNAVAALCTNVPAITGKTPLAGLIESRTWTDVAGGGNVIKIQRYSDNIGNVFVRSAVGATHGSWIVQLSMPLYQAGIGLYASAVPDAATNIYRVNLPHFPGVITDGMEIRVTFSRDNIAPGPSTLVLNGLTSYQIAGTSFAALNPSSIKAGSVSTLAFNLSSAAWVMKSMSGSPTQGLPAVASDEVPNFGQINGLLALKVPQDSATGAAQLPTGTTAQRPGNSAGRLRFNTDAGRPEFNTGTGWASLGVSGIQKFTSSGSFTVPAGVTVIYASGCAGGGGGGASLATNSTSFVTGGGGGGAGQPVIRTPISVTPGQVIPVTIGAGGVGATAATNNATAGGVTQLGTAGAVLNLLGGAGGNLGVGGTTVPGNYGGPGGGAGFPAGGTAQDTSSYTGGGASGGFGGQGANGPFGASGPAGRGASGSSLPGTAGFGFGAGGSGAGGSYNSSVSAPGGAGAAGMPGLLMLEW